MQSPSGVTKALASQFSAGAAVVTGAGTIVIGSTAAELDRSTINLSTLTFDNATQTWVKVKRTDGKDAAVAPTSAPAVDATPSAAPAASTEPATPGLRTGESARARGRAKVDEKKA